MNILFISKSCPNKIKSAGDIRSLRMLEILRSKYDIDVVSRSADYGDNDIKGIGCVSHIRCDMRKEIESIIKSKNPEIVILTHWTIAKEFVGFVKSLTKAKIVIDTIDLEYLRLQRKCEIGLLDEAAVKHTKELELGVYREANTLIMASEIDSEELLKNGEFKTVVLPCLYDINYDYKTNEGRNSYIICNWTHEPNIISTVFICKELIQHVDTKFHVVGKHPPKEIVEFAGEKVEICGAAYEINKFLSGMNLLICPVFFGAGVNGKIIQALAFGIPVVTSKLGAMPLGLEHEKDVMIAETKDEYLDCINKIFCNKELRERLSNNGRELAKNYTFEFWKERFKIDI
jgi:glycosyltransferase involved in cell wall biosynthesis